MRLKEDNTSWKCRGIMHRDHRHDAGLPETEVPRHKGQRTKKERRHINHKHVWSEWVESDYAYWLDIPAMPARYFSKTCTVGTCQAKKYKKNPRYGYLYAKWQREYYRQRELL